MCGSRCGEAFLACCTVDCTLSTVRFSSASADFDLLFFSSVSVLSVKFSAVYKFNHICCIPAKENSFKTLHPADFSADSRFRPLERLPLPAVGGHGGVHGGAADGATLPSAHPLSHLLCSTVITYHSYSELTGRSLISCLAGTSPGPGPGLLLRSSTRPGSGVEDLL